MVEKQGEVESRLNIKKQKQGEVDVRLNIKSKSVILESYVSMM